ncbi:Histidinol-phosphate aminotransferase [Tritonibacter multivorans]|uniref:histidinol-phosphate transaminase n=2 Tax=Tritonibacter multivorans TaxID=928856 RepID=A0A0P1G556_9RHOB|nr:Histidinol-phosphate aminotransferase [Tritonibacter multivorans]SFD05178.1 histidinol-phosphate aminotransferase [Tritonibacter multivorans]
MGSRYQSAMTNPKPLPHTDPRLTKLAQSLPATVPFVGPETQERHRGAPFAARLGANENGFGPSPRAIAAMAAAAAEAWKYGDPESYDLRAALAAHHGVAMENVLIGEGIDGLLGDTVRLFIEPGDAVVTSAGAYPTFSYHVTGYGGEIHQVPYDGDHENPDALMTRAAEVGAKLVYLANPDNPMGSWHTGARIVRALEALPEGALLVLDEAYLECAPTGTAADLAIDDPRVLRFRTFSKAYGLAGARIGYVLGQANLIAAFHRVRNHFGVNRIAQAGALAALADQDWLRHVQDQIRAARARIGEIAGANDLMALPSATNFVTIDCGADGGFARRVLAELLARDIFVRMPFVAPQDRCIRISCGPEPELSAFEAALPDALAAARKA